MTAASPKVVVLAGPNGAGKSTSAAKLLLGALQVAEFVNADTIAQGLSAFAQDRVAFQAGRIMLARLHELAAAHTNFGFETTLASRSYATWLAELRSAAYEVHLVFLWLPSADIACARVAERVRAGGHDVAEDVIRRRYLAGLRNLFSLYMRLVDTWQVIDNSDRGRPSYLIAAGGRESSAQIVEAITWRTILDAASKS
jgi:predicted ABC-type ATPase